MKSLKNITYPATCEYRSNRYYAPVHFFVDAFGVSKSLDLLLGYFSSTALNALALGFVPFLIEGGKMRMVINDVLSSDDKGAIIDGFADKSLKSRSILTIIDDLRSLSHPGKHTLNCLSWMIANDRLNIKIVRPKYTKGIMHVKSGVFSDGNDKVAFKGSCNFTAQGILGNIEEVSVKQSWNSKVDANSVVETQEYFDEVFGEMDETLEYLDPESVQEAIVDGASKMTLEELMIEEQSLLKEFYSEVENDHLLENKFDQLNETIAIYQTSPRFPFPQGPRVYQKEAYEAWCKNDKKGVFAMATGTGKTITALNCLLNEYQINQKYQALIFVPSIALIQQWEKECKQFNFKNIIKVCSGENWMPKLSKLSLQRRLDPSHSFVIITTYKSFLSKKFKNFHHVFSKNDLLIADEAHNMGSAQFLTSLSGIKIQNRIALSATLHRQYDEIGNKKINEFFESNPPYTFSYDMKAAIENDVLCQYDYFPHVVYLTSEELSEYAEISTKLYKFFDGSTGKFKKDPVVDMLLLKRKRIIHKAENKKVMFERISREEYSKRNSLKYSLVYVPEGYEVHSDNDVNECYDSMEELKLLNQYTKIVSSINKNIIVHQFTADTKNRESTLKDFGEGKIDVLTSMKCLDEGVDVPRTELAFFCASTGNPKQFVQRRGRVLRTHKDKHIAIIHDLIVVPECTDHSDATFPMQQSLVKSELERVVNFSFLARNKFHTFNELKEVCTHFKINLFTVEENIQDK
ncbi:DEAD/DEAH box helicase family protein [Halosquirtibacter laminarini]|uniref:DEAD/DEAH box helicase family protein n=1 Tax=Halosquirtibacter laminarini TaxID=3374600 RepID=A0AC61NQF0_9BACT|nr:DEAD/DEAH box helicase family protein [Prolixibacteraceae bacterium]